MILTTTFFKKCTAGGWSEVIDARGRATVFPPRWNWVSVYCCLPFDIQLDALCSVMRYALCSVAFNCVLSTEVRYMNIDERWPFVSSEIYGLNNWSEM